MTLQERITDTKARIDQALQRRQQLEQARTQSERLLIGLDSEMALLEQLVKDEKAAQPKKRGRMPRLAVVS